LQTRVCYVHNDKGLSFFCNAAETMNFFISLRIKKKRPRRRSSAKGFSWCQNCINWNLRHWAQTEKPPSWQRGFSALLWKSTSIPLLACQI